MVLKTVPASCSIVSVSYFLDVFSLSAVKDKEMLEHLDVFMLHCHVLYKMKYETYFRD